MVGFLSSEGVLEWEVSESELVGMDDRLEEEGNWLLMFPVSSLICNTNRSLLTSRWQAFTQRGGISYHAAK